VALQPLVEECGKLVKENLHCKDGHNGSKTSNMIPSDIIRSKIIPPSSVSESLVKSMLGMFLRGRIHLGARLHDLVRQSSREVKSTCRACENYIIFVHGLDNDKDTKRCAVVLRVNADDRDEMKAFLHASILQYVASTESSCDLSELLSR